MVNLLSFWRRLTKTDRESPIWPKRERPVWFGKVPATAAPAASKAVLGLMSPVGSTPLKGPPPMLEPAMPPLLLPRKARSQSTPVVVASESASWPKTVEIMT